MTAPAPPAPPPAAAAGPAPLAGTGRVIRMILRRDRVVLPVWMGVITLIVLFTAAGVPETYPTEAIRRAWVEDIGHNPMELALLGPVYGVSPGALVAWHLGVRGLVGPALLGMLMLIRHTRTEEDSGRRELLGSAAVGRQAPLAAALAVACSALAAVGALTALVLAALGYGVTGSVAMGAAMAVVGWFFAGVGALAAQLASGAARTRGVALGALAVTYLLRAAEDIDGEDGPLAWISPLGWAYRIQPFAGDHWWIAAMTAAAAVPLIAAAVAVSRGRDAGAGVLGSDSTGPAHAARGLRSALALSWRQHRGRLSLASGAAALAGAGIGGVALTVGDLAARSEQLLQMSAYQGGDSATEAMLAMFLFLLALMVGAYGILAMLVPHSDEAAGRAEPLLSAPVGRGRWFGGHLVLAMAGAASVLTVLGTAGGAVYALSTGNPADMPRMLAATLVHLPAVLLVVGVTAALYGLVPRLASAGAWMFLGANTLVFMFAAIPGIDAEALLAASPFIGMPSPFGAEASATPMVVAALLAAALSIAGLAGFRRRALAG